MNSATIERNWNWLGRRFRPTRWTMIRRLRAVPANLPSSAPADEFCRCYWYPLYGFLRQKGFSAPDAQDHVQSFFSQLLTKNLLLKADPERGQLRTYLITLLLHHTTKRRKYDAAQKRGGLYEHVPLDLEGAEAAYLLSRDNAGSPEEVFRKVLAARLVAEGVLALEKWYAHKKKTALLQELMPALEGPLKDSTYADAGIRLGMRPGAVTMAARHLRARFKDFVTDAASRILGMPRGQELDLELNSLFAVSHGPFSP